MARPQTNIWKVLDALATIAKGNDGAEINFNPIDEVSRITGLKKPIVSQCIENLDYDYYIEAKWSEGGRLLSLKILSTEEELKKKLETTTAMKPPTTTPMPTPMPTKKDRSDALCINCRQIRPIAAKQLCFTCYFRARRNKIRGMCVNCHQIKPIMARQECASCYQRARSEIRRIIKQRRLQS
jgi:hypothetical protein